jgi:hypothetical protein
MSFLSNHVVYVKSCHSGQMMSYHSFHVSLGQNSVKSGGRAGEAGVNYVFLGLRRQLCCQAEGKNTCHKVTYGKKSIRRINMYNIVIIEISIRKMSVTIIHRQRSDFGQIKGPTLSAKKEDPSTLSHEALVSFNKN